MEVDGAREAEPDPDRAEPDRDRAEPDRDPAEPDRVREAAADRVEPDRDPAAPDRDQGAEVGREAASDLHHGHYEAWARSELADRAAAPFDALINPLIDAGIGVTPGRRRLLETDPALDFIGTWNFAPHLGSRAAWPAPDLGDALRTPVRSTIPIVLVSGDWDTSTPVENMLAIAPYFPNGHTIVVHRGEHDQLSYQMRADPAAFAAVLAFIATGATAKLPVEVMSPAPTFSVPAFPAPRP